MCSGERQRADEAPVRWRSPLRAGHSGLASLLLPLAALAQTPLPIPRGETQLFVDDSRIAHAEGVRRTLHQPRKDDAGTLPVLAVARHLGHGASLQANGSIVFDPRLGHWVMFSLLFVPALKAEEPDGWQRVALVRYTSADGLAWTSDAPGGIEQIFPRTRDDLFDAASGAHAANVDAVTVWHDAADPEWPYKAWFWLTRLPPGRAGAWFHRSRDGRRFERGELILASRARTVLHDGRRLSGPADTSRFAFDPIARRFLVTLKFYAFHPGEIDEQTGNAFRSRAFLWADRIDRPIDLGGVAAIPLVPAAAAGDLPFDEYYDSNAYRHGSHWIGELKIWHGRGDYAWSAAGGAFAKLMTSADGLAWRRVALPNDAGVPEVWIANGSPEGGAAGRNDGGYLTLFNSPPLRLGDEQLHYYGASSYGKNAGPALRLTGGGVFRARLRLDGFVSVDAGRLTTPPLRPAGDRLRVNSRGPVTIAALDPQGAVLGEARLEGDGARQPVEFAGRTLRATMGARAEVALRFAVAAGAELYSFTVD